MANEVKPEVAVTKIYRKEYHKIVNGKPRVIKSYKKYTPKVNKEKTGPKPAPNPLFEHPLLPEICTRYFKNNEPLTKIAASLNINCQQLRKVMLVKQRELFDQQNEHK